MLFISFFRSICHIDQFHQSILINEYDFFLFTVFFDSLSNPWCRITSRHIDAYIDIMIIKCSEKSAHMFCLDFSRVSISLHLKDQFLPFSISPNSIDPLIPSLSCPLDVITDTIKKLNHIPLKMSRRKPLQMIDRKVPSQFPSFDNPKNLNQGIYTNKKYS